MKHKDRRGYLTRLRHDILALAMYKNLKHLGAAYIPVCLKERWVNFTYSCITGIPKWCLFKLVFVASFSKTKFIFLSMSYVIQVSYWVYVKCPAWSYECQCQILRHRKCLCYSENQLLLFSQTKQTLSKSLKKRVKTRYHFCNYLQIRTWKQKIFSQSEQALSFFPLACACKKCCM